MNSGIICQPLSDRHTLDNDSITQMVSGCKGEQNN
jgi:hypothetical protein